MPHILLVDNDVAITYSAERFFMQKGYDVSVAHTSETAFVISQSQTVDLVVVDYRLPELNGIELLRLMRKKQPTLPAILYTAYLSEIDAKAAQDSLTRVASKDAGLDALAAEVQAMAPV